jgi:hypothetical protein
VPAPDAHQILGERSRSKAMIARLSAILLALAVCSLPLSPQPRKRKILAIGDVHRKIYQHDVVSHALATIERLGYQAGIFDTYIRTDIQSITNRSLLIANRGEIARRIGEERMQKYLDLFEYGNRDIGGGIDQFWLTGNLRIDPVQQIDFVDRLRRGVLPVSKRSQELTRDILPVTKVGDATIRANVDAFLATHGMDLAGGNVLMAANARAFGNGFNPISVFWCFDAEQALAAAIVEVHNTYGGRHAYVVHPDERGRARVDKSLYVSPFHGTDGWYDVRVPVPGDDLFISVTLHTDDGATTICVNGRSARTTRLTPRGHSLPQR